MILHVIPSNEGVPNFADVIAISIVMHFQKEPIAIAIIAVRKPLKIIGIWPSLQ